MTAGGILIGMDILKNLDIHMGVSKVSGKYLFLASDKEEISKEYLEALKLNFGKSL